MKFNRFTLAGVAAAALFASVFFIPTIFAESQGLTKKTLLQSSVSGDDTKETVIVMAEFAKGGTTGRHTHPGDEYSVVLEGTLELLTDGSAPKRVSAGEAYHNPRGVIHEARNVGEGPARVEVTFVVDKGKSVTQSASSQYGK
jgi:quercetin dioxygenase-like cupin family protein